MITAALWLLQAPERIRFWPEDWSAFLLPNAPIVELVVRGTLIYLFLILMMRVGGRRLFAKLSMADIIIMLVIAVAVRDGITGTYETVGDAVISGATIFAWNKAVDILTYHFPALRGPLRHSPLTIIHDGDIVLDNARDNLLTRTEIMEKLRAQGVASVEQVKEARLEPDGNFSVIRR